LERIKIENNKETNTYFVKLFDKNLKGWNMIGNGSFEIILENVKDKKPHPLLMTQGDRDYYGIIKKSSDFILMLEWSVTHNTLFMTCGYTALFDSS
jgi:hypothetical protein